MPFDPLSLSPRRIAIIGGGISGLAAAHLLAPTASVVLYEAEPRLGGHARTIVAGRRGDQPVDTGFIVFNHATYPGLTALFRDLEVPTVASDMSFGASIQGGWLEYALATPDSLFAQRRNLARPRFLAMLRDILRFNAQAEALAGDETLTLRDLLGQLGTGDWFRDHYIAPFSGAIWSTPCTGVLDFPAQALVRFFRNHGLMGLTGQHPWYTVQGGSVEYVRRLQARLTRQGVDLRPDTPVAGVRREAAGVLVRAQGGEWELFDEVVFATHSDDTLRLLSDPSPDERRLLSAIRYQPNQAVLHADASVMPRRRKVWSSWNYVEPQGPRADRIDLTYWMNRLQPIPQDDPLFVTLNGTQPIRDELIHDVATFRHPVYDRAALAAQSGLQRLNGQRHTWFAGAWMKNGFHEDGFASAVDVATALAERRAGALAA